MPPNEQTELVEMSDVVDSEIVEVLSRMEGNPHIDSQKCFCPDHPDIKQAVKVMLRCHRVLLAQDKRRTRLAVGWSVGVITALFTTFEFAKPLLQHFFSIAN